MALRRLSSVSLSRRGCSAPRPRGGLSSLSPASSIYSCNRIFVRPFSGVVYDFENLVEMQEKSCKQFADRKLFGTKNGKEFSWMTFGEFAKEVDKARSIFASHKIGANDKVALISNNRVEWAAAFYAANGLGAQLVPMYEAQAEKDWKYIINDSESKLVLVATDRAYEKAEHYVGKLGKVESVLCFDSSEEYLHSYKRWRNQVTPEAIPRSINPDKDDISIIIYTSGTTGNPKGVNLTHNNIVSNLYGLRDLMTHKLDTENVSLCFLPWSHVFGLTAELNAFVAQGSAMGLCPNRDEILEAIGIVKPNVLLSVPTLFNRVYDAVHAKIAAAPPIRQKIFFSALAVSRERNHKKEYGRPVSAWLEWKFKLADKIVFSKIRENLGGRLEYIGSGGAATSLKVIQFFEDIGVPILEGYGLTETSPVISASSDHWGNRRLGCAGVPLNNVIVKIIDPTSGLEVPNGQEGEICVSGPSVMEGYRNNKEANDEVFFTHDGLRFFHTGDLGMMVDNRFLKVTGRIKELYKLENGKYITPVPLEDTLCRSQFIFQCMIYGSNRPYNVALIVPDFVQLIEWAKKTPGVSSLDLSTPEAQMNVFKNESVVKLFNSEIIAACSTMKGFEKIHRWIPIPEQFSQENHLMTPKMSLRRNLIVKKYEADIEEAYGANSKGFEVIHDSRPKLKED